MTQPIFVVGSGRSGTQSLWRMLGSIEGVEMNHEYMVHLLQPAGVMHFHGKTSRDEILELLRRTYGAAVHFCQQPFWGDCSNKASWFIEELAELFPEARFVHLVRDGRKVTSSLFNKLGHECLDDRSVNILRSYLFSGQKQTMCPPPEKKYWWPLADPQSDDWDDYQQLDHYGRIAYHWQQINCHIEASLSTFHASKSITIRLEDITSDKGVFDRLMAFLRLENCNESYELIKKPFNVIRPENIPLAPDQLEVFWRLCGDTMKQYHYDSEREYRVNYQDGGYIQEPNHG